MPQTDLNKALVAENWVEVETLLDNGANPNEVGTYGWNALHLAVIVCGDRALFQRILHKIVDINAVDIRGNTALIIASKLGFDLAVEDIMEINGVDRYHRNNFDMDAEDYANQIENLDKKQRVMNFLTRKTRKRTPSRLMGLKNTLRF